MFKSVAVSAECPAVLRCVVVVVIVDVVNVELGGMLDSRGTARVLAIVFLTSNAITFAHVSALPSTFL